MSEQNSTKIIENGCHIKEETDTLSNINSSLKGSIKEEIALFQNNDSTNSLFQNEE